VTVTSHLCQRRRTLLNEFKDKDRAGGIVDRRFGENDPSMSIEERMLERFTRERQRASQAALFNLEDEDELTHYGQSLSKLDDFDNVGLGLDDDDDEEEQSGMSLSLNCFLLAIKLYHRNDRRRCRKIFSFWRF
jgi:hypothetical protein